MDAAPKEKRPKSPALAHARAEQLLKDGAAADAKAIVDAALLRWPSNTRLSLLKGDVLKHTSGPVAAAVHYSTLLSDSASSAWALKRLILLMRETAIAMPGVLTVAENVARTAMDDPKFKAQMLERLLNGVTPKGRPQLLAAIAPHAKIFKYEAKVAVQQVETRQFTAALTLLENARAGSRSSFQYNMLLSDLLALDDRLPDSIALLELLLAEHPDQPDVYRRLTMMLQRAGNFDRAAEVFEQAVQHWPNDWLLVYRLNRLPIETGRFKRICEIIDAKAHEAVETNDRFRFQFALALLHLGRVEQAVTLLDREFQEPTKTLAMPVLHSLAGRPATEWLTGSRLVDDRTKEVQIATSPNARATVVLTTGVAFGNLPLAFIDTLLAAQNLNVVYLRDFGKRAYLRGVATLGAGEAETIVALKRLVTDLGARRTIMMGSSSGGFSALRYGALMEADWAVSFSGQTDMTSYFKDTRASAWNPLFFVHALSANLRETFARRRPAGAAAGGLAQRHAAADELPRPSCGRLHDRQSQFRSAAGRTQRVSIPLRESNSQPRSRTGTSGLPRRRR
jgi:tetratricopeptide (TPR) repeat protein